jgi:hypothetical protein
LSSEQGGTHNRGVKNVARDAHALSMFRILRDGTGRQYTATTFPRDPLEGCEHFIRTGRALGFLSDDAGSAYGVLDVLNENGDVVQDFGVRDAKAFQWIKRKLNLRVESDD